MEIGEEEEYQLYRKVREGEEARKILDDKKRFRLKHTCRICLKLNETDKCEPCNECSRMVCRKCRNRHYVNKHDEYDVCLWCEEQNIRRGQEIDREYKEKFEEKKKKKRMEERYQKDRLGT
jgi:hypothetical protein